MRCYIKYSKDSTKKLVSITIRIAINMNKNLYYKLGIKYPLDVIQKLDDHGNLLPNVRNKDAQKLSELIKSEMQKCSTLIERLNSRNIDILNLSSKDFISYFDNDFSTDKVDVKPTTLVSLFNLYIENLKVSAQRIIHYRLLFNSFYRFLRIKVLEEILPQDFSLMLANEFKDFYQNEYRYVKSYPYLFENMKDRNIPAEPRCDNTTAVKMKQMCAFFNWMVDNEYLQKNVFSKVEKHEDYKNTPVISLMLTELKQLASASVPDILVPTRDAFVFQSLTGLRINEFQSLSKKNYHVANGIPYIYFYASKTGRYEVRPLIYTALQIVKKLDFNFPILKNVSGSCGYNKRIKKLLEYVGIKRQYVVFDANNEPQFVPLYELASSHTARKTFCDIVPKSIIQNAIDITAVHATGSKANDRYTNVGVEPETLFYLYTNTFQDVLYKVDANFDVIENFFLNKIQ